MAGIEQRVLNRRVAQMARNLNMFELSMNRMSFSFKRFSLTPALSRWERGNCPPIIGNDKWLRRFVDFMRDLEKTITSFPNNDLAMI